MNTDASTTRGQRVGALRTCSLEIQQACLDVQGAALDAQRQALKTTDPAVMQNLVSIELAATKLMKAAMRLQRAADQVELLGQTNSTLLYTAGIEALAQGRLDVALTNLQTCLEADPTSVDAHKALGDVFLQTDQPAKALVEYDVVTRFRPDFTEVENNMALAHLATFDYQEAEKVFRRMLGRDHGLPERQRPRFTPSLGPHPERPYHLSPFKLQDRIDQLSYLIDAGKLHRSFGALSDRYRALLDEAVSTSDRKPYTQLSRSQVDSFEGYYDKVVHYRDTPRLGGPALNPDLNCRAIEEEYLDTRMLSFDDMLSPKGLTGLRQFFMESTIFFRHSEAGFVGTYVTDGLSCGLIFQLIEELHQRFPRILAGKALNNMWCYRYGSQGPGVRPHNGDGSVTFNFYLTPDDANVGDRNGGGMVMYNKVHPAEWDWLTFNLKKDEPEIQGQIATYLEDAKATTIPYRCNRSVLFHSTLFHKTDPFHFKDDFVSRRMNITMLFGRRSHESASVS